MKKGITKEQALQIIADHIELGEIKTVKHDDGSYSVIAVCSDGFIEIKPNNEQRIIEVEEYSEKFVTKIGLFCVYECDWGEEEVGFYHDCLSDKYFLGTESGFSIGNCPSDIVEIDPDLVDAAMACFCHNSSAYGYMGFDYDDLKEHFVNE